MDPSASLLSPSSPLPSSSPPCAISIPSNDPHLNNPLPPSPSSSTTTTKGEGEHSKPPFSYASLIAQAILNTPDEKLTLSGIYSWVADNYPYFKAKDNSWQNSIRHNLSLNKCFVKVARNEDEPGKGSFWTIEPSSRESFENGSLKKKFSRRRDSISASSQQAPIDGGSGEMEQKDRPTILAKRKNSVTSLVKSRRVSLPEGVSSANPAGNEIQGEPANPLAQRRFSTPFFHSPSSEGLTLGLGLGFKIPEETKDQLIGEGDFMEGVEPKKKAKVEAGEGEGQAEGGLSKAKKKKSKHGEKKGKPVQVQINNDSFVPESRSCHLPCDPLSESVLNSSSPTSSSSFSYFYPSPPPDSLSSFESEGTLSELNDLDWSGNSAQTEEIFFIQEWEDHPDLKRELEEMLH